MTIEEKLQHFMDATTQKVNAENASQIEDYEKGLEKVLSDYKEMPFGKAQLSLKLKEESLKKAEKTPRWQNSRWKSGTDRKASAGAPEQALHGSERKVGAIHGHRGI